MAVGLERAKGVAPNVAHNRAALAQVDLVRVRIRVRVRVRVRAKGRTRV